MSLISHIQQGYTNFPHPYQPPHNSRCLMGDMKQVPYWGPTKMRCNHTEFCHHSELAPGICAPLEHSNSRWQEFLHWSAQGSTARDFEVFTTVLMKIQVLWGSMLCQIVNSHLFLKGAEWLHLRVKQSNWNDFQNLNLLCFAMSTHKMNTNF